MKNLSNRLLYILWALLFGLTAALGLAFPDAGGALRWVLLGVSLLFFVPPFLILGRARAEAALWRRVPL